MNKYIQITTTIDSKSGAEKIANTLVEQELAACVQIISPVTSVYKWKGKTEKTNEWLCLIKTKESLFEEIEENIKSIHPYDVPEIIATPTTKGNKDYLDWIDKSTR